MFWLITLGWAVYDSILINNSHPEQWEVDMLNFNNETHEITSEFPEYNPAFRVEKRIFITSSSWIR